MSRFITAINWMLNVVEREFDNKSMEMIAWGMLLQIIIIIIIIIMAHLFAAVSSNVTTHTTVKFEMDIHLEN